MSKPLMAVLALGIAAMQAWDSNAFRAELWVQAMVLVGVVAPAAAILTTSDVRVRGAAVLFAAVLMVTARVVSAQHMPELALAAFFPGILVLLDHIRTLAAGGNPPLAGPRVKE